jgi:hypothetical protein
VIQVASRISFNLTVGRYYIIFKNSDGYRTELGRKITKYLPRAGHAGQAEKLQSFKEKTAKWLDDKYEAEMKKYIPVPLQPTKFELVASTEGIRANKSTNYEEPRGPYRCSA